ncbi:MAG: hypothetical protein HYV26_00985 [Candidatus Hydrogenedentes bacterium]|nr:hypothetical protein [Candidatus Hydrogenedentota bacterium]
MKTIDLRVGEQSLNDLLKLAKNEAILIRTATGEDFVLESAHDFDIEVATLGASQPFMDFLDARSKEPGSVPMSEVRRKRGL